MRPTRYSVRAGSGAAPSADAVSRRTHLQGAEVSRRGEGVLRAGPRARADGRKATVRPSQGAEAHGGRKERGDNGLIRMPRAGNRETDWSTNAGSVAQAFSAF